MLAKIAILDKIYSYALKEKGYSPKEREAEQPEEIGKVGIPQKTPDERGRGIADAVKQLL